jgi:hypothetical protein
MSRILSKNRWLGLTLCIAALPACIYTNITRPLDTDLDRTELGSKVGEASSTLMLGLVAWGHRGTRAAAEAGGITTVRHMDIRHLAILGFVYATETTIVYGD